MSFFKSLPEDAGVRHILSLNPQAGRALVEFHTAALRNEGPLAGAKLPCTMPYSRCACSIS